MNALDGVSEFEENLMNELDSDFMSMVPNPQSQYIMQHMDIREPLTKLRKLIENRLGVGLQGYVFALQGVQIVSNCVFIFNLVDLIRYPKYMKINEIFRCLFRKLTRYYQ